MSAKDLDKSVEFYRKALGGEITRRVEPTAEQLRGASEGSRRPSSRDFEVHLFDASIKPREVDPHHTLSIPWQEQKKALSVARDRRQHRESPAAPG